jgi:hypothetical protein
MHRGHYLEQIKSWLEVVDRSQLMIVNFNTLIKNTTDTVVRMSEFLGLEPGVFYDKPGVTPDPLAWMSKPKRPGNLRQRRTLQDAVDEIEEEESRELEQLLRYNLAKEARERRQQLENGHTFNPNKAGKAEPLHHNPDYARSLAAASSSSSSSPPPPTPAGRHITLPMPPPDNHYMDWPHAAYDCQSARKLYDHYMKVNNGLFNFINKAKTRPKQEPLFPSWNETEALKNCRPVNSTSQDVDDFNTMPLFGRTPEQKEDRKKARGKEDKSEGDEE